MVKAAGAILIICIIGAVAFWFFFIQGTQKASPAPDFTISNVRGRTESHVVVTVFFFSFNITNNGTATAHEVNGTVKIVASGEWPVYRWSFSSNISESVLLAGRNASTTITFYEELPIVKKFLVTVSCKENIHREFNVTLPS
jgi:hypothetical protein